MIRLETDGTYRFKIDGNSFAKDSVLPEYHPDGEQVRFVYNGQPLYDYQLFSVYADGDNSDTPFASMDELRQYIDTVFYVLLPFAKPFHLVSAATVNETSIKTGTTILSSLIAVNTGEVTRYLKVYDMATAPDAAADGDKIKMVLPLPGVRVFSFPPISEGGEPLTIPDQPIYTGNLVPVPVKFDNGLSFAITANPDADDDTAIVADEIIISLTYR